eukprot:g8427.t1
MTLCLLMELVGLAAAAWTRSQAQGSDDRVLLQNVQVLTLYDSRETTGRRSAPVPQLSCQGGCGQWTPEIAQCYNMGSDGTDAAWKCEASMPDGYSFSSIEVGCEGYDYPKDPFILKGSCQLMYSLKVPRSGGRSGGSAYSSARQWEDGHNPTWDGRPADRWKREAGGGGAERDFGSRLVTWAVLGVVGYVLCNAFVRAADAPPRRRAADGAAAAAEEEEEEEGGGGGGGGGGDNWRGGGGDTGGPPWKEPSTSTYAGTAPPPPAAPRAGAFPWLAGGGIGAALGYMLRPRERTHARPRGGTAWNQGYGMGGGMGGGGTYRRRGSGGGEGGGGGGGGGGYSGDAARPDGDAVDNELDEGKEDLEYDLALVQRAVHSVLIKAGGFLALIQLVVHSVPVGAGGVRGIL